MHEADETCGCELARDADVPEALGQLMVHVAANMERHAEWVGTGTEAATHEGEGLREVALHYRAMGEAAERAASRMRGMRDLPAAEHDPAKLDRVALVGWMRAKIEMQRRCAELLSRHADDSEKALATMGGGG